MAAIDPEDLIGQHIRTTNALGKAPGAKVIGYNPHPTYLVEAPDGRRYTVPVAEQWEIACGHGLLPAGDAPVVRCVLPLSHDGLHKTFRGVSWAHPDDGEDDQ
jgi:hypothetical protein